jgi:hypothetical protein
MSPPADRHSLLWQQKWIPPPKDRIDFLVGQDYWPLCVRFSQRQLWTISWDLTPWRSHILDLRWFLLAYLVYFSTLKMGAARSPETSLGFALYYYTTSYPYF